MKCSIHGVEMVMVQNHNKQYGDEAWICLQCEAEFAEKHKREDDEYCPTCGQPLPKDGSKRA